MYTHHDWIHSLYRRTIPACQPATTHYHSQCLLAVQPSNLVSRSIFCTNLPPSFSLPNGHTPSSSQKVSGLIVPQDQDTVTQPLLPKLQQKPWQDPTTLPQPGESSSISSPVPSAQPLIQTFSRPNVGTEQQSSRITCAQSATRVTLGRTTSVCINAYTPAKRRTNASTARSATAGWLVCASTRKTTGVMDIRFAILPSPFPLNHRPVRLRECLLPPDLVPVRPLLWRSGRLAVVERYVRLREVLRLALRARVCRAGRELWSRQVQVASHRRDLPNLAEICMWICLEILWFFLRILFRRSYHLWARFSKNRGMMSLMTIGTSPGNGDDPIATLSLFITILLNGIEQKCCRSWAESRCFGS